jgi:hypothetical protein
MPPDEPSLPSSVVKHPGSVNWERCNKIKCHTHRVRSGGDGVGEKTLTNSASSIVLELLGRTAKHKSSELGRIITTPTLPGGDQNTAIMSANNPGVNTSGGAVDGNPINSAPSKQKPNHNSHNSVVPQLMDIYDDLAQSSTPQTNNMSSMPMTQAPMTMSGVHYSGYQFLDSNSQISERSNRRRSGSQSPHPAAEADDSLGASVALARTRRVNASFKADDSEDHYGGGKQPPRKKGKISSSDNRWSKRFTWPDEVSGRPLYCDLFFASVLMISICELFESPSVPPRCLCGLPT